MKRNPVRPRATCAACHRRCYVRRDGAVRRTLAHRMRDPRRMGGADVPCPAAGAVCWEDRR